MKRSWFGAALLLALLGVGLFAAWLMDSLHEPVTRDLQTAAEAALTSQWEQALTLSRQASEQWEKYEKVRACFADHSPMEEIDASFGELEVYGRMKEETAFAASCAEIARKVEAMGQAHALQWQNLF